MTHDELKELIAGYAIDALTDDEARDVERHLASCPECRAELESLEQTVDAMAGALQPTALPSSLRERTLRDALAARTDRRPAWSPRLVEPTRDAQPSTGRRPPFAWPVRRALSLAAVLAIVLLSASTIALLSMARQTQTEMAQDRAALALLTSTETENDVLARASSDLPEDAHGHWFHRPGVMTQVIVGERLPAAPADRRYVVWLRTDAGWTAAGDLPIDEAGYGRLIVLGSDGSAVREVEITRESRSASPTTPAPSVMLRFPPTS